MLHNQIEAYAKEFRLSALMQHYKELADKAAQEHLSYSEYLLRLLEYEATQRAFRARTTICKLAGFPIIKTLEQFDYGATAVDKTQLNELATLGFIDKTQNILLLGPSGVGKTHIAIALGYLATQQRIKTKYRGF